jgi:hypothetical protein
MMLRWNNANRLEIPPGVGLGYVAALATGSATFIWFPAIWFSATNSFIDHAPASPNSPVIWVLILLGFMSILPFLMLFAFFFTIVPFFVFASIYLHFGLRNILYFIMSGSITGALISLLFSHTNPPIRDVWVLAQWPYMLVCGAAGGFAYWWVTVWRQSPALQ